MTSTAPSAPTILLSANTIAASATVKVGIVGGSWGTSGVGDYSSQYSADGQQYTTWHTGVDRSVDFCPASFGFDAGDQVYLRVVQRNAQGLTATSAAQQITCVADPSPPVVTGLSASRAAQVTDAAGSGVRIKIGGRWVQALGARIKLGGRWVQALGVRIKIGGRWREAI